MNQELRNHLIWALYVPSALIATAFSLLIPVMPIYASSLTSVYVLIGIMLAADATGRTLGDLPSSFLLRRLGMKATMMIGGWLTVVPLLLLFWVNNIWLAVLLLLLAGIGSAFYNISRHAFIAAAVETAVRGRAIGLMGGVFRIGKFVGPVIGGWVGGTFGLRYVFLVFVFFALATQFFVWRYMDDPPVNERPLRDEKRNHFADVVKGRGRLLAISGAGQIFAQLCRQGWITVIPLYAAMVLKLDVQTIGLIVGAGSALDMTFFYLSGVLMDRFGRKWAIVPSFMLQGLGVALIPFTGSALTLGLVSALIGFSNALSSGTMMTVGSDLAPPDARGEFLSLWRLVGDIGFVGGPMLVGVIAQMLVLQSAIFAIAGTGFGTALLFAFFVPETLKKPRIVMSSATSPTAAD